MSPWFAPRHTEPWTAQEDAELLALSARPYGSGRQPKMLAPFADKWGRTLDQVRNRRAWLKRREREGQSVPRRGEEN